MRIRKRSVPLPLSLASTDRTTTTTTTTTTLPIVSDPPLKPDHQPKKLHPSSVDDDDDLGLQYKTHLSHQQLSDDDQVNQTHLNTPKLEEDHQAPSDLQLTIIREKNGWICSDGERNYNDKEDDDDDEYWCMNPNQNHMMEKNKTLQGALEDGNKEEMKIRRSGEDKKNEMMSRSSNINNLMISTSTTARRTPRNELFGGAEVVSDFGVAGSSHHQTVGTSWDWGEGERTFTVKKRRGSFEINKKQVGEVHDDHQAMAMEPEKDNSKTKARTTSKKKWVHEKDQEQAVGNINNIEKKSKKREQNGGAGELMEGSRCSRINGRGWRCCQQTLVGYSLCEHHLGKGRLRSMSSVGKRSKAVANSSIKPIISKDEEINHSLPKEVDEDNGDHHEEEEDEEIKTKKEVKLPMLNHTMINKNKRTKKKKKKKKKIGMVKARSISSLLCQTQQYGSSTCHTS